MAFAGLQQIICYNAVIDNQAHAGKNSFMHALSAFIF